MIVENIMTRELLTVKYDDLLVKAYNLMKEKRLRHLPVVDETGKLIGILSHRDVLNATKSHFEDKTPKEDSNILNIVPVESMMTRTLATVAPDTELRTAADTMRSKKISCLPVLQNKKLVGILTESDFLKLA